MLVAPAKSGRGGDASTVLENLFKKGEDPHKEIKHRKPMDHIPFSVFDTAIDHV
jgi:hypothetical protein